MAVKVKTYGNDVKRNVHNKIVSAMVVSRGLLEKHIKDLTPVITGNLLNSTYGTTVVEESRRVYCQVWQAAHYSIFVEARRFHFTFGMKESRGGIKEIFQKVRI